MMKSAEFKAFFYEAGQWLVPYAQYCHLRDTYGTADFSQWPDHQTWNEADRKALSNVRTRAYKEVESRTENYVVSYFNVLSDYRF